MLIQFPAVTFNLDDPKRLAEYLVVSSYNFFVNSTTYSHSYECNGQWIKLQAGGRPFRIDVIEMNTTKDNLMFSLQNTGDGLTYQFSDDDRHSLVSKRIIDRVKEVVLKQKHRP